MPDFQSLFQFLLPLIAQQRQGVPSLEAIYNQQPITPPFAGGQIPGLPPQGNPYEILNTVLQNIQNQPLQQAPQPGKVQSILNALAGGLAVAQAKNPGEVLSQQIQGREQQRLLLSQQMQQRQNMLDQARLQVGVNQASDLAREQADYRKFQRESLRADTVYERNRKDALTDLKKTGIVNQELADLEGARALKFYKDNKPTILSRAEDEAYVRSLPERDQKALMLATEWKSLDPSSDSVLLNELAKKVLRGNEQLKPIERQLYNRLEDLRTKEISDVREEKKKREVSEREQIEAVTQATKTGQRYAGQQDRYANAFDAQQGAQASRVTSANFYKHKTQPGVVIDEDQFAKLKGTTEVFDYIPLSEEENVQERNKRYLDNVERNKRLRQRELTQGNKANPSGGAVIDLANDVAGSRIAELFAKQGLEATRKIILDSSAPQEEKLRLLKILEQLSGQKQNLTNPTVTPTPKSTPAPAIQNPEKLRGFMRNQ